jgi:hypothetical protein
MAPHRVIIRATFTDVFPPIRKIFLGMSNRQLDVLLTSICTTSLWLDICEYR